jgi:hypothetical protein
VVSYIQIFFTNYVTIAHLSKCVGPCYFPWANHSNNVSWAVRSSSMCTCVVLLFTPNILFNTQNLCWFVEVGNQVWKAYLTADRTDILTPITRSSNYMEYRLWCYLSCYFVHPAFTCYFSGRNILLNTQSLGTIWGSHIGDYEELCLRSAFTLVSSSAYSSTLKLEAMHLQNVLLLSMDYTALYIRRQFSSLWICVHLSV